MNTCFLAVLNMSLTASVLCGAVLMLRVFLRGKLPRWVFYCLWGLVLARLLFPISLPSPVSVFNAIPAARPVESAADPLVFVEDRGMAVQFPTLQAAPSAPAGESPHPVVASAPVEISTILASIWLCGVVLLLFYSGGCYVYTMRRLRAARLLEHTPEVDAMFRVAGISPRRVRLYSSSQFGSPVVCGLIRPRLILSHLVEPEDLPHVIAHELTHIRRCDNLWKALATLALYLHWFNPLLWYCYRGYVTDMEASCDEAVVRQEGCDRRAYANSLVHMAVKNQSAFSGGVLAFGECALKERVVSIMNVKKYAVIITIICFAMILGLAAVFLTNPQAKPVLENPSSLPAPPAGVVSESSSMSASSSSESSSGTESSSPESALEETSQLPAASAVISQPASAVSQSAAPPPSPSQPENPESSLVLPLIKDNPPAFQLDPQQVDYFNLVDRDTHTYCAVTEDADKARLIELINSFPAKINTTDQPDPQKLRMIQLRYKDGTKREYWLHNNLIMTDNLAYKMNDPLRMLYTDVVELLERSKGNMGPEWLGLMNPYRITQMSFPALPEAPVYTATATLEQRDAILNVCTGLKSLRVKPSSMVLLPKAEITGTMNRAGTICLQLDFENIQERYTIYLHDDQSISLLVGSIDYMLSYQTMGGANEQALLETLHTLSK